MVFLAFGKYWLSPFLVVAYNCREPWQGIAEIDTCDIQNVPGSAFTVLVNGDGWKKGDVIFTAPSTGNFNVAVNFAYNSEKIYHDSYGLFDLTAAFGAGQEPPYQWCHDNLGYYSEDKAYDIKYR